MPWYAPLWKALRAGGYFAYHVLVGCGYVAAFLVINGLLKWVGDPKFFDWVPIRYMFDAMDIGVFGVFVWFGIKDAIKVFREDGGEANDS